MIKLRNYFNDYQSKIERIYGSVPKDITFQVTDSCNLNCSYCYQINKGKRVMSLDTAKKFIDLLFSGEKGFKEYLNLGNSTSCILDFIGGEPLLQVELIDDIITYFRDKATSLRHPWATNFMCSMSSNGTLYFDEKVQKFLEKNKDILSFNISIDGNKELHDKCRVFYDGTGSYDIASKAVADWMGKGRYMSSKMTISPENVMYVSEASKHMVEMGYDDININCVFEEGWNKEHAKILYNELVKFADYLLTLDEPQNIYYSFFSSDCDKYFNKGLVDDDNWCGGNGKMIACDPDGRIYPCIRYMESSLGDSQKPICIGDVDNGIGNCAECKRCLNLLKGITKSSQSTKECLECPISGGCSWCSGYNYQRFGTLNHRATFICDMHKAASLANVYYINKLNRKFNDKDRYPISCPKDWAVDIIGEEEYSKLVELSKE